MRFPNTFKRVYPATPGTPTLGGDSTPSGLPMAPQDNGFSAAGTDSLSPVTSIALAFTGPAAAALQATLYVFEQALGAWLQVGPAQTVTPNQVFFFDSLVPVVFQRSAAMAGAAAGLPGQLPVAVGSAQYLFIVTAGASPQAGNYVFAACPLLAN